MKKTIFFLSIFSLVIFYSCNIKDTATSTIDMLQHKWTHDSLLVNKDLSFTGEGYKKTNLVGYTDVRNDGKMYSSSNLTLNGLTKTTYDTAVYTLKDNNTIISYSINLGILSTNAVTLKINTLTDKLLVATRVSKDPNSLYSRVYFHR